MKQDGQIFNDLPLRLRLTRSHACAYLEGRQERRLAADITQHGGAHDQLAEAGFRRIENWVYRPACEACQACIPIRVNAKDFRMSRNLSRIWRTNQDLTRTPSSRLVGQSHYQLFLDYLNSRHQDGQMASMSFDEFSNMVHNSPIETALLEYRTVSGELMACMLLDIQRGGLSAVYSFYNPEEQRRSLGSFMVIDLVQLAREMGLDWVYLGYYVADCRKMIYKARFQPSEVFINGRWVGFDQTRLADTIPAEL